MFLETRLFEVRDIGTHIPVMATRFIADQSAAAYPLRRAGYGAGMPYVMVAKLDGCECHYDPMDWGNRTMRVAHDAIGARWDTLPTGSVIDAEYEMGLTAAPKTTERLVDWPLLVAIEAETA
jgi:hypothetical protein